MATKTLLVSDLNQDEALAIRGYLLSNAYKTRIQGSKVLAIFTPGSIIAIIIFHKKHIVISIIDNNKRRLLTEL